MHAQTQTETQTSASTQVVIARGLCKRYAGRLVVDELDLEVRRGECFGLLGPNGAGKTTTLRMLLGGTPPSGGSLRVMGQEIPARARLARCGLGVVPQTDNLDPDFTVEENLTTYGSYFGVSRARMSRRLGELLEFAALGDKRKVPIDQLSGGMKRRLTLARALVNDPELLILDEPTTGLDPQARQLIWQRLRTLIAGGKTLILTTHYMEEAERLCDRLVIMDQGRILVQGSPEDLVRRYSGPHVVEVYGAGLEDWVAANGLQQLTDRSEMVGETLFCYTRDEGPLLAALAGHPGLRYLHRAANLEDVFLRLTGRDLREL